MVSLSLLNKIRKITVRYPILRGMFLYAITWPSACTIEQFIDGHKISNLDWKRILRYSLYGSLYVAPTLYGWIRLASNMWPGNNIKAALTKAVVEQISYSPFATTSFYVSLNLLEFKSIRECVKELRQKFWPSYKVGVCLWPTVQTLNFAFVPERNRVPFVSIISFMWIIFLAYMKHIRLTDVVTDAT